VCGKIPAVAEFDELKIPNAVRPVAEEVIKITGADDTRMLVTYNLLYMTNIRLG
jgi:hypothetical protein